MDRSAEKVRWYLKEWSQRQPGLDVSHFVESEVWKFVLLGTPRRSQVAEVLGVEQALFESPLGDGEQEEEHETEAQPLD